MASTLGVFLCAGLAAALWTCVGVAVAAHLAPRTLILPIAPALGWALCNAVTLPILMLVGMSRTSVVALTVAVAAVALLALRTRPSLPDGERSLSVPAWAFAGAALLALAPMVSVLPKVTGDGVALASPIFDHAKIAMIDEMARLGVPPGNPFFAEVGGASRLSYYYLWHFSASTLALLTGASGWEADAGLTWFTAFASLSMMMGFAVWLSGRPSAAAWVVVLAATASIRPIVSWLIGRGPAVALIDEASGLGGWLFQASWAPQHVASAMCVVLAVYLFARLAQNRSALLVVACGLVAAAAFQSSAWVGGVAFPLGMVAIVIALLRSIGPEQRIPFLICVALAAVLAIGLASPFIYDQFITTAMRAGGAPIRIEPYRVLGAASPDAIRPILNLPAYWLAFLVIEFPAFYFAGIVAMVALVRCPDLASERKLAALSFACMLAASLGASWLLVSTLGENNDLGWRAILPAVMVLIVFASAGLSHWLASRKTLATATALCGVVLGLPEGATLIYSNAIVTPQRSAPIFAQTPAMWQAVRQHTGEAERVANNPLFLRDMTPWPANISWALLANRRSCYAAADLVGPFVPLTAQRAEEVNAQFVRVFAGAGTPDDVRQIAAAYGCRTVVLAAQDGAWVTDPFAASPLYRLVEQSPAWRIYRTEPATVQR